MLCLSLWLRVWQGTLMRHSDFAKNATWLRAHRTTYVGTWVALFDGQLVDYDRSRLALHRRLEAADKLVKGTLFVKLE